MERTLHPEGIFKCEVVNAVLGETQAGNPQIIAEFRTEHGNIRGYFSLSEKAVEWTAEKMMCMGFKGGSWADVNAAGYSMAGNKCQITVKHDEYEGKVNAKVGFVYPENYTPGLEGSELASANAKKFDAILHKAKVDFENGVKREAKPKAKPKDKAAPPGATEPAPFDNDDQIPF